MKHYLIALLTIIMLAATTAVHAANPDDILGVWNTEDRDAKIEIYKCGTKYCGKVVWLSEPTYPAGSEEGTPGTPLLDRNNPDPALRKAPLVGLSILHDFVFVGGDSWKKGKIYSSENGKTYSGKLTLVSPHELKVRGFIGISLFGGSTTWKR